MNPYFVLGIADGSTKAAAKAAYRKLAMEHHPDRGGDEEKFKSIKAAWNLINSGKAIQKAQGTPVSQATARSSFNSVSPMASAGRPAAGYAATNARYVLPKTTGNQKTSESIIIELTEKQAFHGCVVPFRSSLGVCEWICRPGTLQYKSLDTFVVQSIIGQFPETLKVEVKLKIAKSS